MQPLLRTAAATVALTLPALAQGSMDFDKATSATLGGNLTLDWSGVTPGRSLLVIPSLNSGPIPLSILDPLDSRVLTVGTDLPSAWFFWPATQSTGSIPIPVPNAPVLHGFSMRFQTVAIPGSPRIFGELSNVVQAQLGASGSGASLPAVLNVARALAVAIADRDDDAGAGNFVIAGGGQGTFLAAIGLQSTERYGFREMNVQAGPNMTVARAFPATVELTDGRTLLWPTAPAATPSRP